MCKVCKTKNLSEKAYEEFLNYAYTKNSAGKCASVAALSNCVVLNGNGYPIQVKEGILAREMERPRNSNPYSFCLDKQPIFTDEWIYWDHGWRKSNNKSLKLNIKINKRKMAEDQT